MVYECDNCGDSPSFDLDDWDGEPQFLNHCSACKITYYCDKRCQKQHWSDHKLDCKNPQWRSENQRYADMKRNEARRRREALHERNNEIVETTGETRLAWNNRITLQPPSDASWGAFQKRARMRKGLPIQYRHPVFADDQILRFDLDNVDISNFKPGTVQIEVAPELGLADSHVDLLAAADLKLRLGVRAFIAGDTNRMSPHTALEITDAGVQKLCKTLPNLEVIKLYSTRALRGRAVPEIFLNCANIEAVTVTAVRGSRANLDEPKDREFFQEFIDKAYREKLRYMEFRGVHYENKRWLSFLTKRRKDLEVVFEDEYDSVLIRDAEGTPLSDIPPQSADPSHNAPKQDKKMNQEARARRRENAKRLKRAGRLDAMSSALGRPLNHMEMDSDDDDELTDSDDDGMDDNQYNKLMHLMAQMNGGGYGGGYGYGDDDDDYY